MQSRRSASSFTLLLILPPPSPTAFGNSTCAWMPHSSITWRRASGSHAPRCTQSWPLSIESRNGILLLSFATTPPPLAKPMSTPSTTQVGPSARCSMCSTRSLYASGARLVQRSYGSVKCVSASMTRRSSAASVAMTVRTSSRRRNWALSKHRNHATEGVSPAPVPALTRVERDRAHPAPHKETRQMSQTVRRFARALAVAVVACGAVVLAAPAASADPKVPFSQDVYARTHLAKSGMDITVPPGLFEGTIDLATGEETGNLTLPPATVTMNLFGVLPVADASFVMAPAGPITGHVDLATFNVDTTASFNVKLAKLTPHGTDVNLVGDNCTTTEPITVRMQGVVNPAAGGTFASTYSIPSFQDCQLLTEVITAFVSGPGNTFVASFAPHGAPAPAAP